jgi:hypothetical protein
VQRRAHRYCEFRRTGAERDHGEADDERRNAKLQRGAGGTAHERAGAREQRDEAENEPYDV